MLMNRHCPGDKLCSKSKLFLIRTLSVSKDSGECKIIGPGSDMRQVVSEVQCEMETINPCFLGGATAPTKRNCLNKKLFNN